MYAASATRTNAGIMARQMPVILPRLLAVKDEEIARLKAENQALRCHAARAEALKNGESPANKIISEIAYLHGVPVEALKGPRGTSATAWARHHAMYEIRRRCPQVSFPVIARLFGGRHHTTAIEAVRVWPAKAAALGIPCEPINLPVVKGYTPEASHGA